jgi:lysophospholipase L1-like esterase
MRSRRHRLIFSLGAIALSFALSSSVLLAIDVHLHHKFERGVLFNVWGYRGPAAGRKQPGEYRVAVLGGSAAYGFGVTWDESMPAQLERKLSGQARRFRVVNLAYNNEGAYSFGFTLKDYAYLRPDLVVLYEGYNDLMGDPDNPLDLPTRSVFRHLSPIFRLTGYLPVFPIIFREKASVLLYGDTRAAYAPTSGSNKTTFKPGLATRTASEILQSAADIGESLERQLGSLSGGPPRQPAPASTSGCRYPWAEYCQSISTAVTWALDHHQQVLVVTQPYALGMQLRARHVDQQRAAATMLAQRFHGDRRLRYVNLGEVVALDDPMLSFDRMHLTPEGNERIANALVEPVIQMAEQANKGTAVSATR